MAPAIQSRFLSQAWTALCSRNFCLPHQPHTVYLASSIHDVLAWIFLVLEPTEPFLSWTFEPVVPLFETFLLQIFRAASFSSLCLSFNVTYTERTSQTLLLPEVASSMATLPGSSSLPWPCLISSIVFITGWDHLVRLFVDLFTLLYPFHSNVNPRWGKSWLCCLRPQCLEGDA